MPALGLAQETGKLVRWLKRDGEQVAKGEPLMEVETDKATVEVESPASGTLTAITAAEGDDVAVGHAIAVILAPGESSIPPRAVSTARPSASPKARRLAEERGVDLAKVAGSGPDGAILEEDILQAGGRRNTEVAMESALWRAMSENVTRSWKQAPHFFVFREVDAGALVEERRRSPEHVTYTDLLLRSVASALVRHPRMNGDAKEVNIGLAVAVQDGLIVPVIHSVESASVEEIATERHEVVERVRGGRLRAGGRDGGAVTLT